MPDERDEVSPVVDDEDANEEEETSPPKEERLLRCRNTGTNLRYIPTRKGKMRQIAGGQSVEVTEAEMNFALENRSVIKWIEQGKIEFYEPRVVAPLRGDKDTTVKAPIFRDGTQPRRPKKAKAQTTARTNAKPS